MVHRSPPRRLRVVHVINSLSAGGAETMLSRLVGAAGRSPFEHVVLPLREGGSLSDRIRDDGALVEPLRVDGVRYLVTSPARLAARLRDLRPDVVQGWLLQGNLAASIGTMIWRSSVPVLWNVRWTLYDLASERPTTRVLLRASGALARHPRRIVFNAQRAVPQHAGIGFPSARARVIPNGYDTDEFRPDADARSEVRRELDIPPHALVVGMLARYHPMKNHELSVRAAARVHERRPDTVFVYAGRGVDEGNPALTGLVQATGLVDSVRLLGERLDTARLYNAFDVYWMSSVARGIAEGFPNVVAEAMACGVPCVATDIGDARTIIGETGRVVASDDGRAFADATIELLEAGPDERARLGREARERIARDYSLDAAVAAYDALYEEVLAERRDGRGRSPR